MARQLNTFNRIAPFYDTLKGLVFGNTIHNSQTCFVECLPREGSVLIIGGGSGEMLSLCRRINPRCRIWYVEASSEMLSMAAKRLAPGDQPYVTLIHGTETSIPSGIRFDAVITNFFLDLFPNEKVASICRMISSRLVSEGIWLVSDFVDGKRWWQRILLKSMYGFFAVACNIESRTLPFWEEHVRSAGMVEKEHKSFFGDFIKSVVYIKDV